MPLKSNYFNQLFTDYQKLKIKNKKNKRGKIANISAILSVLICPAVNSIQKK